MPEPGENETEEEFISRCIPMVIEDGTAEDEKQAYAICKSKWREAKGEKSMTLKEALEVIKALKVGARHSQRDQRALQDIHDAAITLGAACPPPQQVTEWGFALDDVLAPEKALVSFGGAVKALGGGKIGGYLVRFSDEKQPDLTDDFFTRETDYDMDFPGHSTVYFNHGLDPKLKQRKLSRADLRMDDFGIWAETILQERDEYEKFILEMVEAGKMGWSSGTASHLVEREPVGKAHKITRWPLGLDATLTHTPAEPRNTVIPLKMFLSELQSPTQAEAEAEAGPDPAPEPEPEVEDAPKLILTILEKN